MMTFDLYFDHWPYRQSLTTIPNDTLGHNAAR